MIIVNGYLTGVADSHPFLNINDGYFLVLYSENHHVHYLKVENLDDAYISEINKPGRRSVKQWLVQRETGSFEGLLTAQVREEVFEGSVVHHFVDGTLTGKSKDVFPPKPIQFEC